MKTKVNLKETLDEIKRQVRKSVIDQLYEGCTSIYFEEFINQFYIYIDGMDLEYFYKVVDLNETEWDEIPIFVTDNGGELEIEFCLSDDYIDECKENGIELIYFLEPKKSSSNKEHTGFPPKYFLTA